MKSLNMYNCGLGRIEWNDDDDDDFIDALGLDSREPSAAQYGFPAARMATSEPPAAQLALQPPGWAGADVF
ncbi:hypothetical protein Tco_1415731 [Tanacetum coccineum]